MKRPKISNAGNDTNTRIGGMELNNTVQAMRIIEACVKDFRLKGISKAEVRQRLFSIYNEGVLAGRKHLLCESSEIIEKIKKLIIN